MSEISRFLQYLWLASYFSFRLFFNSNPSWVGHFLIQLYFASISFYKISTSLRTSTATLISLKTSVVGHTTWQRVIHGLFSLQAPGLATLNQALRLCLVRWLIPYQSREEGADGAFSV